MLDLIIPDNWESILIRLLLSLVLGGIIGAERAYTNHDAGLRTHILVCLGAAGIMIMSEAMHLSYGGDVGRIGAQVVSGIGFLGAGCILVGGNRIRGLTTAAGLWTTACIGLCIGMGYYFVSVTMTLLMVIAMIVLHPLSEKFQHKEAKHNHILKISLSDREAIKNITACILEHEFFVSSVSLEKDNVCFIKIDNCTKTEINRLGCIIMENECVYSVEITK